MSMEIIADRRNLRTGGIHLITWQFNMFFSSTIFPSPLLMKSTGAFEIKTWLELGDLKVVLNFELGYLRVTWHIQHVNRLLGEKLSASDVNVVVQAAKHNVAHILTLAPSFTCHANSGIGHLVLTSWIDELNKIVITTSEPKHKKRPISLGCRLLKCVKTRIHQTWLLCHLKFVIRNLLILHFQKWTP